MNESAHDLQAVNSGLPEAHTIHCTHYDLIEAISEEVEPGEERLIVTTVLDLIELGKVRCANGDAVGMLSDRFICICSISYGGAWMSFFCERTRQTL
jgi:hypothetical protein